MSVSFLKGLFKDKPEPHLVNYPIPSSSTYEEATIANDNEIDVYTDETARTSVSSNQNTTSGEIGYPVTQSNPGNVNYYNDQTSSPSTTSTEYQNITTDATSPTQRRRCDYLYATDMAHCGGSGRCQRCGGDGLMDDMFGGGPNSLVCSSCGHSGKCSSCNGTGYLD